MTRAVSNDGSAPPWLTVAICTWNRCDLLRQTLEQFTRVRDPSPAAWEMIVINNNSTDQTEAVVRQFEGRLPVRCVFEPAPGLSNARNRAVHEARGDYILWTDDDVLICEDWLTAYAAAFHEHPEHALFGGPIEPWFPEESPRWLLRAWPEVRTAYAVCDFGAQPFELSLERTPIGANYAVRRDVHRLFPFDPELGRKEKKMLAAEETLFYEQLFARGFKGRWIPTAKVRHYIPPQRQTMAYLYGYYHGIGMSSEILRLRDDAELHSPRFLGAPRWLWRHALTCEMKLWVRRLIWPIETWMTDFQRRGRAWGRIAVHRARGKELSRQ